VADEDDKGREAAHAIEEGGGRDSVGRRLCIGLSWLKETREEQVEQMTD
jgi:hypothetical protein